MEVKVLEGQSLFDLAVQVSGSTEAAFNMAGLNGLSITDVLTSGSVLIAPDPINKPVSEYYRMNGLKPATDVTIGVMDEMRDEGIDYWAIEVDFIVT
jgi:hypothetical protein